MADSREATLSFTVGFALVALWVFVADHAATRSEAHQAAKIEPAAGHVIPDRKPDMPLTDHQIRECRDRIEYNNHWRDQGSVRALPVAPYCDRLED